jgi:hypothetical protein
MAELPLVFFILLFLFIFPLINLCGICLGACTVYLTSLQVVGRTSKQLDFPKALTAFEEEANTSNGSPLMTFLKTHPVAATKAQVMTYLSLPQILGLQPILYSTALMPPCPAPSMPTRYMSTRIRLHTILSPFSTWALYLL